MAQTYQVILTRNAHNDLQKIVDYLDQNASYEAADKVRAGILKAVRDLKKMPTKNPIVREISKKKTYRRVLKWSYKIIYTVQEEKARVTVVDIAHIKQNPQRLIEKFGK